MIYSDTLSLNRFVELCSRNLTLGKVSKFPLLSLNQFVELCSRNLTLGKVSKFPLLSLNRFVELSFDKTLLRHSSNKFGSALS